MRVHLRSRSFEPCDQDAARHLILAGLGEHVGWIDETRNPENPHPKKDGYGKTDLFERVLVG